MAILNVKIPTNLTEYPNSFKRQGSFPLEAYSVFYASDTKTAYEEAENYAKNNPISYVGQIVAVVSVDDGESTVDLYKIENEDGELKEVGNTEEVVETLRTQIGGCTWYIDTDAVTDTNGNDLGTLSDCMTDEYAGRWFYAISSTSTAGESTYPEKYTIDGANGYLSLRDYVIWTGNRLVHIPTFEAKASTVKNSDGKYSPKSGVDGLFSSTDKAYLTDLINRYIAACQSGNLNSGNDCNESGLYGNITSGRPGGTPNTEYFNAVAMRDHTKSVTSQMLVSEATSDLFVRGTTALSWAMMLKTNQQATTAGVTTFEDAQYGTWLREPGIYVTKLNTDPDGTVNSENEFMVFVYLGSPTGTSRYDITQIFVRKTDLAMWERHTNGFDLNVYEGIGNYVSEFVQLYDGVDTGDDVIVVTDDMAVDGKITVTLTTDVKEVVVKTNTPVDILLPEKPYLYWRFILNTKEAEAVTIDVGFYDGQMFGSDYSPIYSRKTYMIVCEDNKMVSPSGFPLYEVDDVTRCFIPDGSVTEAKLSDSVKCMLTEVIDCTRENATYTFSGNYQKVIFNNLICGDTRRYEFPEEAPVKRCKEKYASYNITIYNNYMCNDCYVFGIEALSGVKFDECKAEINVVYDFENEEWKVVNYTIIPYAEGAT